MKKLVVCNIFKRARAHLFTLVIGNEYCNSKITFQSNFRHFVAHSLMVIRIWLVGEYLVWNLNFKWIRIDLPSHKYCYVCIQLICFKYCYVCIRLSGFKYCYICIRLSGFKYCYVCIRLSGFKYCYVCIKLSGFKYCFFWSVTTVEVSEKCRQSLTIDKYKSFYIFNWHLFGINVAPILFSTTHWRNAGWSKFCLRLLNSISYQD